MNSKLTQSEKYKRIKWLEDHGIDSDRFLIHSKVEYPPPIETMEVAYNIFKDKTNMKEHKFEIYTGLLGLSEYNLTQHIDLLTKNLDFDRKSLSNPHIYGRSYEHIYDRVNLLIGTLNLNRKILDYDTIYDLSVENISNHVKLITEDLGLDKEILNFGPIFGYSTQNIFDTVTYFRDVLKLDDEYIVKNPLYIGCSLDRIKESYNTMVLDLGFNLNDININHLIFTSKKDEINTNKVLLDSIIWFFNPNFNYKENPNLLLLKPKDLEAKIKKLQIKDLLDYQFM
ncbi:MAG: hypothetical protein K0B02_03540 [DPANN group archaeon]|nr:hypothetical protein [DPANN group archaeon]